MINGHKAYYRSRRIDIEIYRSVGEHSIVKKHIREDVWSE
jgi:hypothetical protein